MSFLAATDNDRHSEFNKEGNKHTATTYNNYLYTGVWDQDKIFGCECDEGYTGFDCSLRYCPTGDDPLTTGQANEVQAISCSGTNPFTITFRGKTTDDIAATASLTDVQAALQALKTIRSVSVSFTVTTACAGSGNTMKVTFTNDFGNLPVRLSLLHPALLAH